MKISAKLDAALRDKLGIKINHLVQGTTPLTLAVKGLGQQNQAMSMEADLTDARLLFGSMGWVKETGQIAKVSFDVGRNAELA